MFSYFLTGIRHDQFVREAIEDSGIDVNHPLYSLVGSFSEHLLHARSTSLVEGWLYNFNKENQNQKSKFYVNCTRAGLEMTHWKPYYTYNFEAGKETKF
jgi:hypothetical protein